MLASCQIPQSAAMPLRCRRASSGRLARPGLHALCSVFYCFCQVCNLICPVAKSLTPNEIRKQKLNNSFRSRIRNLLPFIASVKRRMHWIIYESAAQWNVRVLWDRKFGATLSCIVSRLENLLDNRLEKRLLQFECRVCRSFAKSGLSIRFYFNGGGISEPLIWLRPACFGAPVTG